MSQFISPCPSLIVYSFFVHSLLITILHNHFLIQNRDCLKLRQIFFKWNLGFSSRFSARLFSSASTTHTYTASCDTSGTYILDDSMVSLLLLLLLSLLLSLLLLLLLLLLLSLLLLLLLLL